MAGMGGAFFHILPSVTARRIRVPLLTTQTIDWPPCAATVRLGTRITGGEPAAAAPDGATPVGCSAARFSWNVTLVVISGFTCWSASRMVTRTSTIDFARSAEGKICRSRPL